MIVETFINQYPTRWKESHNILHLKAALWPASLRYFSRGEIMMSHIFEAAPFPSPDSCGGGLSGIDPI